MSARPQDAAPSSPDDAREGVSRDRAIAPLRVCILDMNQGHENQAMRCFRSIVARFFRAVNQLNPSLRCELLEVSPRDTMRVIPREADIYVGSGGPGSPFDGDNEPWFLDYARFSEEMVAAARLKNEHQKSFFGVCYTFELMVRHFKVARVAMRDSRKFGVMPIYTTGEGQHHPLLRAFGDRLFAFEHRNWEAVEVDEGTLRALGGSVLARESRDGYSKGRGLLGVDFGEGIEGVQFHPEADRAGVVSWVARPEQAAAFRETYGEVTYQAMLRTLDDPNRLAKTFALVIPGFLVRRFNLLAPYRGYVQLAPPGTEDVLAAFSDGTPPLIENVSGANVSRAV
jgi:homoserine O-succinyltransferase/O-acetyltransferase